MADAAPIGFNTQPPEGGWIPSSKSLIGLPMFQHTAARRRLVMDKWTEFNNRLFQHTAARRRLGTRHADVFAPTKVSTHSRPKAAGRVIF